MKRKNYIFEAINTSNIPKQEENKKGKGIWLKQKSSIKKGKKLFKIKKRTEKIRISIPKKYKDYIKSKWWKKRKIKYYQKFGKKCAVCKSIYHIQLHHLIYGNYGFEKDEHLIALCSIHHEEYHKQYGVKENMFDDTNEFIKEQIEILDFPKFS